MKKRNSVHVVIPSASRLIESLRDMGYDFKTAVADLVDNSIEAGAKKVNINLVFNGKGSWVRISDNGKGMTAPDLKEAMRYGANRKYELEDLGKFGLGLKTASTSQCQRLVVASRTSPDRCVVHAFAWDLDHVRKTNNWEIIELSGKELDSRIVDPLLKRKGTVVLWEKLDRILDYKNPDGDIACRRLNTMCRELEEHLSMVFHRFISGEVSKKPLEIYINENKIRPWDPFVRDEKNTKSLSVVKIPVEYKDNTSEIILEPFVLPNQSSFSSTNAANGASGPKKWNKQQGFYVYRSNRMIQSGGWCGLRTDDEHTKLARVALSFSPVIDDAFKINVSKMRVELPPDLIEAIKSAITPVTKIADEVYRKGEKSVYKIPSGPSENENSKKDQVETRALLIREKIESSPSQSDARFTIDEFFELLEKIALPEQKPVIKDIYKRLIEKNGTRGN